MTNGIESILTNKIFLYLYFSHEVETNKQIIFNLSTCPPSPLPFKKSLKLTNMEYKTALNKIIELDSLWVSSVESPEKELHHVPGEGITETGEGFLQLN